ncbi:MAG: IPT/TIG domain-containing protein [Muribaculaceae bacterium]|nr:IPT/TIG domain-containing protein [Muribaculaceae bacterium]
MNNRLKYTFAAMAGIVAAGTMVSCSETYAEQDKGATPVIKYARTCNINQADSLVASASLGAHLCFVGDNLGDVQQVWFNDQKAKLNPTMVTSNTIIVDIPNVIPGEVTNIARFITSTGIETQYPFEVSVPAPRVDKMSCEYAPAGETVTIGGAYFADDPNVPLTVSFGNVPATVKNITQNELTVVVPEGAVEAPVVVTSIYGKGESSFHYLDTSGMLFDFDGITGLGTAQSWHARPILNDETSISGNYIALGDGNTTLPGSDAWDDNNFSFEYWAGSWNTPTDYPERVGSRLFDIADFSDFNNKSLKFEVCIPADKAWQSCAMQLIFAGTDRVSFGNAGTDIYGNQVAGCNNSYFQSGWARGLWSPWSVTEAYHTDGKWITVSFPIKDFVYQGDGSGADSFLSSPEDFASLQLFLWNGGVAGVDCTPFIKIDNIRVVKN